MPDLTDLIIWEVALFLLAMFGIVAVQVVTGHISMKGLLMKKEGDRSFSPERVQLLLATLAAAFQYVSQVLKDPTHLPAVSRDWILLLGGSHALYLGRRFYLRRTAPLKRS
ncbi:MAG TPA: hypothetical protein VMT28_06780 [Terriglobales bacterium]|jgi:hypothetical protein|nr:hypothetical protein [Terriglobales bacterium]